MEAEYYNGAIHCPFVFEAMKYACRRIYKTYSLNYKVFTHVTAEVKK